MGNQDSGGTNTPYIIRSLNAALYIGTGDSWSSEAGGTLTTRVTFDSSGNVGIGKSAYGSLTTNGIWLQPNNYTHISANTANSVLYVNQNGSGPISNFVLAGIDVVTIANFGITMGNNIASTPQMNMVGATTTRCANVSLFRIFDQCNTTDANIWSATIVFRVQTV
jgi:hypothetical protein